MKKIILSLVCIIFTINLACSSSFSPTSLIFNLESGKQECKQVNFASDSVTISIEDKFGENKDIEWKVTNFDKNAGYHLLTTSYPAQISNETGKLEYCLSGTREGEYHGVLILKEEQSGNSIVQMGIWIKATITSSSPATTSSASTSTTTSSSSGGGSSTQAAVTGKPVENKLLDETQDSSSSPTITGSAIGTSGAKALILPIAIIVILVIVFSAYAYYKRRQRWLGYS